MEFYERLENLRKEKGISQKTLETLLGFSNGSVSKWKNHIPTAERLQKLSDFFEVSVEYLLCKTDNRNEGKMYFNTTVSPEQIVDALKSMGINANYRDNSAPMDLTVQEKHVLELWRNASQEARQYASLILESRQPNA